MAQGILKNVYNQLCELPRFCIEYFDIRKTRKGGFLNLPHGNGEPVLFIPGFLTGDAAMGVMHGAAETLGYKAVKWECGVNWGASTQRMKALKERFERIARDHPNQKIAIVGWSLGGIYARELARTYPRHVSCAITLGTPFGAGQHEDKVSAALKVMYQRINPDSLLLTDDEMKRQGLIPPQVPTTSIFSKKDAIVDWNVSLNPPTPLSENIEITDAGSRGQAISHTSLVTSHAVISIMADRLHAAYSDEPWAPFKREQASGMNIGSCDEVCDNHGYEAEEIKRLADSPSKLFVFKQTP